MTTAGPAEGPITHRTKVTTPNSSTKVRRDSSALCQMMVRGGIGFPGPRAGARPVRLAIRIAR